MNNDLTVKRLGDTLVISKTVTLKQALPAPNFGGFTTIDSPTEVEVASISLAYVRHVRAILDGYLNDG